MAGTDTGTNETHHAGGTCVLVKGSRNVLASLNGTACSGLGPLPLHHLCARGWGREVSAPSYPHGAWARHTCSGRTEV